MPLASPSSPLRDPRPEDPCTCNLCNCELHVPINSKRACKWCALGVHGKRPARTAQEQAIARQRPREAPEAPKTAEAKPAEPEAVKVKVGGAPKP